MNTSTNTIDIKELTKDQLVSWLVEHRLKSYRAKQILRWIHHHQADTFNIMTDVGKETRKLLSKFFTIDRLKMAKIEKSKDGSKKYLFQLKDGQYVESVLIPEKGHYTLCLSSQVGCAQGCKFCLTGKYGFVRNLTQAEIISQVRDIKNHLGDSGCFTNIVLMGMGEPLANYNNVVSAAELITDTEVGLGFSSRRLTISTVGLVPKLSDLGRETSVNLAISLNASDNKTRNKLMPINRKHPIEQLLEACARYPLKPRGRITFEYVLLKGINDSIEDAQRLVKMLRPIQAKINLIPFNDYPGSDFMRPEESAILKFKEYLNKNNYTAIIRHSKGQDISAACGQLGASVMPILKSA